MEQRPDIIQASFAGDKVAAGLPLRRIVVHRVKRVVELLTSPIFQAEYLFLVNAPYGAGSGALFLHRSFWRKHPLRRELRCVPLAKTGLYQ